ncbi:50S ribosomal protein L32e [Candidatus Pacearchaeota archaeon]|nr:50S ribosomal protein L32e [Candidatus Pacearchaeota archaeon]
MSKEFRRQEWMRHLKLGKKKRKVSWRQPKGRHSKMRQNLRGYPKTVSIGYKREKSQSGKINNLTPVLVHNLKEANTFPKNSIAIIARIGAKKKLEIIKILNEKKIKILNVRGTKK